MLRLIFVSIIIAAGSIVALKGPFYGLLFYLWNAYFRPESWVYGGSIIALNLSFIIGAYVVLRTLISFPNPKLNIRTGLLLLFLAQCVVGAATSEHPEWSWGFLNDFGKVLIISYLLVILVNDRQQFRLVLLVIGLSLAFETSKQGWANLFRAPGARNDNPIPFLGDNNGVAVGTMMLLPILAALAQTSTTWWQKYAHRFLAVGVFFRGISTYSRGGFLGAAALGVVMFFRSEKKIRFAAVTAAFVWAVWVVMPQAFFDRMSTITVEEDEQRDSSAAGRLHFWGIARDMAAANPWTGVGLNAFSPAYASYDPGSAYGQERAAHSVWFGILGDLGYPGLILLVSNVLMAFWSCWQVHLMARRNNNLRDLGLYANALQSSLVVFCVSGSFLSYQYNEMAWHLLALSTALHFVARRETSGAADISMRERAVA